MQNWWDKIAGRPGPIYPGPIYVAIADAIDDAVRTGLLRGGERLPPQRDLAKALGVDLTTVTRAYGLAREAGLIQGSGRLGSHVRNTASAPAPDIAADSGMILPPQPAFALLPDALRTGMARQLRAGGQSPLLQYQPTGGSLRDRREAASAFSERGIIAGEEDVIVTAGGQNALHAILGAVLTPGMMVAAGRFTYPGLIALAKRLGLRLYPLAIDADGILPDAIERAAQAGARALYVVPTNDNPTTATIPTERRREIGEVCRRLGLTIIEDDAYGQLPSAPLPSLATFAPERTWHIASTSKIISPSLRVAHVRAPTAAAATKLAADIHETAVMAPPLNAALVTQWLRDGSFATLIAAVRDEGMARQHIVARHLAGIAHAAHPEGYHFWLRLPPGISPAALAAIVRPAGLSIVPGEAFAIDKAGAEPAVRISIGGALDHARLGRACEQLARVVKGDRRAG